jgi:hypothetical protein
LREKNQLSLIDLQSCARFKKCNSSQDLGLKLWQIKKSEENEGFSLRIKFNRESKKEEVNFRQMKSADSKDIGKIK